jgi:hypothetical protein
MGHGVTIQSMSLDSEGVSGQRCRFPSDEKVRDETQDIPIQAPISQEAYRNNSLSDCWAQRAARPGPHVLRHQT